MISGALFPTVKSKETQPDFTGVIESEGRKISVVAWLGVSKTGKQYISIKESLSTNQSANMEKYGEYRNASNLQSNAPTLSEGDQKHPDTTIHDTIPF